MGSLEKEGELPPILLYLFDSPAISPRLSESGDEAVYIAALGVEAKFVFLSLLQGEMLGDASVDMGRKIRSIHYFDGVSAICACIGHDRDACIGLMRSAPIPALWRSILVCLREIGVGKEASCLGHDPGEHYACENMQFCTSHWMPFHLFVNWIFRARCVQRRRLCWTGA